MMRVRTTTYGLVAAAALCVVPSLNGNRRELKDEIRNKRFFKN
jgi:hypothetical protein